MNTPEALLRQYGSSDPLQVRIETHRRYSERVDDLDWEARKLMGLTGVERILDVGCGTGAFLIYLRRQGHRGDLVGLDQSPGMVAHAWEAAAGLEPPIEWLQGDAGRLPFSPGAFDWVSARHMLYHVEDIPGAVREFARVAPRLIASTNSRRSLPRIHDLLDSALTHFGRAPHLSPTEAFGIENAEELLRGAYGHVKPVTISNAFVFTTAEPIVAYIASMQPVMDISAANRDEVLRWLAAEAERRLKDAGGVWRDPKDVGFYLCDEPRS